MKWLICHIVFNLALSTNIKSQIDYDWFYNSPEKATILHIENYSCIPKLDSSLRLAKELRTLSFGITYPLRKFPSSTYNLPSLNELSFSASGKTIDDSIIHFKNISDLFVFGKKLKYLPNGLGNFSNLKKIVIESPHYLVDSTESICKLQSLEFCQLPLEKWPSSCKLLFSKVKFLVLYLKPEKYDLKSLENADSLSVLVGRFALDSAAIEHLVKIKHIRALSVSGKFKCPSNLYKLGHLEAIYIPDLNDKQMSFVKEKLPQTYLVKSNETELFQQIYLYPDKKFKDLPHFHKGYKLQ